MDKRIKKILYTKKEILKKIKDVTMHINKYYENEKEPIVALGLLKGCINFFGNIITKFNFELVTEFIKTSVTKGSFSKKEVSVDYGLTSISIKDKKVLILEDVVDSAITLKGVIEILKSMGAKEIKVVTLLDKVNCRKVKFKPNWTVIESQTKDWLVGWGLDVNEWGRRFSYIASIKEEYK